MPKKSYALEQGGPDRISISWKSFWKNFTVKFDDQVVGTLSGQKELQNGQTFELPDGSVLDVKLARTFVSTELQLLRNGKALPGSGSDPRERLKFAYGFLYLIGGLNFLLGIIALLFRIEFLLEIGMGLYTIIIGGIYLLLAFFVQKRSKLALIIALTVYSAGTILSVLGGAAAGVVVRILFIILMWQGFKAIKELKAEETEIIAQ